MLFDIPTTRARAARWAAHDAAARVMRFSGVRAIIMSFLGGTLAPLPRDCRAPERDDPRWPGEAVRAAASAPAVYVAANNNRRSVVVANDGPSADWLAERNAAGYATECDLKATRIERALIADESPAIVPLRAAMEALRYPEFAVANDNNPIAGDGEENSGFGLETEQNQGSIKPSPDELLRAMSDGLRPHIVTTKCKAREERAVMLRVTGEHHFDDGWHVIGTLRGKWLIGLVFQRGALVAYGDRNRRRRTPWYDATRATEAKVDEDSETAKHIAAQPDEDRAYIRMAANDNDAGVPWRYGRIAGISEPKGVGSGRTSAARHAVLQEMDRSEAAAELDPADVAVIEAVMADSTFTQIGVDHGYAASSAHKMGRRLVLRAANNIQKKMAA